MAEPIQMQRPGPTPLQQGDAQTITDTVHPGIFEKLSKHFSQHG